MQEYTIFFVNLWSVKNQKRLSLLLFQKSRARLITTLHPARHRWWGFVFFGGIWRPAPRRHLQKKINLTLVITNSNAWLMVS